MLRELTDEERIKYAKEIAISRKSADSFVFGYKKRELIDDEENSIKTVARGNDGVGWIKVSFCDIESKS
jgi:hypothetical protein